MLATFTPRWCPWLTSSISPESPWSRSFPTWSRPLPASSSSWRSTDVPRPWSGADRAAWLQQCHQELIKMSNPLNKTGTVALGSILQNYFCHKITARFWCIVWYAQWFFKWTYLCLLLRIRTVSSWWCKFTDANPFSVLNNASIIAVFLQQLYYGQIWFLVLVPGLYDLSSINTCQRSERWWVEPLRRLNMWPVDSSSNPGHFWLI